MKKKLLVLLTMIVAVMCCFCFTACQEEAVKLEHTFVGTMSFYSYESSYPGLYTDMSTINVLNVYSDGTYKLDMLSAANIDGLTEEGENFCDTYYTLYGTYTVSENVYTLSSPTRIVYATKAPKAFVDYMPTTYIDSADSATYAEGVTTEKDQLDALLTQVGYVTEITTDAKTNFIVSSKSSLAQ